MIGRLGIFAGFDSLAEQLIGSDGRKSTGQMELVGKVAVGAGALSQHNIIQIDVVLDGAGRAYTDDVLHAIAIVQLVGVDADGRHAHTGGHNADLHALVSTGVAVDATDIVHQNGVFQEVFSNEFAAQRIAGHQHSLTEIAGSGSNMRGRCS